MSEKTIKHLVKSSRAVPVWTKTDATYADQFTVNLGIDTNLLMENAGKAVADMVFNIVKNQNRPSRILIFVGLGNNGADAVVTARHLLARKMRVTLYLVGERKSAHASLHYQLALIENIHARLGGKKALIKSIDGKKKFTIKNKPSFTVVVDGIFGAGLNRAPDGLMLSVIEAVNYYKKTFPDACIVSIDLPSGLTLEARQPLGSCIKADYTVTFHYLKRVHICEPTKALCGRSISECIGLFTHQKTAANFLLATQKTLTGLFLPVKKSAHKGRFGHVLVLEGHNNFLGAYRMSAFGALRVGAGLVTIATQKPSSRSALDHAEFMHCPIEDLNDELLNKIDSFVLGPGLSQEETYQNQALALLNRLVKPPKLIVLDADGLPLLHDKSLTLTNASIIATPHSKEAAQLLGCRVEEIEQDRFLAIEALAQIECGQNNQIIWVLKGATTLIRNTDGTIFALVGELPVLAAGGSGDILSGTIAGLITQTPCPLAAALLAVSLQIEAGRILSKSIFKGSLATELADLFPLLTKDRPVID